MGPHHDAYEVVVSLLRKLTVGAWCFIFPTDGQSLVLYLPVLPRAKYISSPAPAQADIDVATHDVAV